MAVPIILLLGGLMLIMFGIYCIARKKNSRTKIIGIFLKCNVYKNRYSPVFHYKFNAKTYELQTWESISGKRARKFVAGQQYALYVNGNKPNQVCLSRKVSLSDWFMIGLGIIFLHTGFFAYSRENLIQKENIADD